MMLNPATMQMPQRLRVQMPAPLRPFRSSLRQAVTCRVISRRALMGTVCGCGLCQGRLQWYDQYFAWNMSQFEEEYEGLVGSRKADLFSDFTQPSGPAPLQVIDIGAGTLPNSRYYKGCHVTAVDPNRSMEPYARENAVTHGLQGFEVVEGLAEQLPLDNLEAAVQEVKRVLKPGGKLLFWDHISADSSRPLLRLSQTILNPLQQALADGCHLNRDPLPAIQEAGFIIEQQYKFTVEGLGLIGPHQCGIAVA